MPSVANTLIFLKSLWWPLWLSSFLPSGICSVLTNHGVYICKSINLSNIIHNPQVNIPRVMCEHGQVHSKRKNRVIDHTGLSALTRWPLPWFTSHMANKHPFQGPFKYHIWCFVLVIHCLRCYKHSAKVLLSRKKVKGLLVKEAVMCTSRRTQELCVL